MKNNITLIGMPGSGKSTVGVVLAKRLGRRFVDSDLVIQETEGKLLSEIIEEKGPDGVTYDILYDILIKQNGEIHSDWTGVKMDVDAYRRVVFEPYDLKVLNGTIDF